MRQRLLIPLSNPPTETKTPFDWPNAYVWTDEIFGEDIPIHQVIKQPFDVFTVNVLVAIYHINRANHPHHLSFSWS